jgi:hypothetical protein
MASFLTDAEAVGRDLAGLERQRRDYYILQLLGRAGR